LPNYLFAPEDARSEQHAYKTVYTSWLGGQVSFAGVLHRDNFNVNSGAYSTNAIFFFFYMKIKF